MNVRILMPKWWEGGFCPISLLRLPTSHPHHHLQNHRGMLPSLFVQRLPSPMPKTGSGFEHIPFCQKACFAVVSGFKWNKYISSLGVHVLVSRSFCRRYLRHERTKERTKLKFLHLFFPLNHPNH